MQVHESCISVGGQCGEDEVLGPGTFLFTLFGYTYEAYPSQYKDEYTNVEAAGWQSGG